MVTFILVVVVVKWGLQAIQVAVQFVSTARMCMAVSVLSMCACFFLGCIGLWLLSHVPSSFCVDGACVSEWISCRGWIAVYITYPVCCFCKWSQWDFAWIEKCSCPGGASGCKPVISVLEVSVQFSFCVGGFCCWRVGRRCCSILHTETSVPEGSEALD